MQKVAEYIAGDLARLGDVYTDGASFFITFFPAVRASFERIMAEDPETHARVLDGLAQAMLHLRPFFVRPIVSASASGPEPRGE